MVTDLQPGVLVKQGPSGEAHYEYTHLLNPDLVGFKMWVRIYPKAKKFVVDVESGNGTVGYTVGRWDIDGGIRLVPEAAHVNDEWRTFGVANSMYDAFLTHGKKVMGASYFVKGEEHTPELRALALKHGLTYEPLGKTEYDLEELAKAIRPTSVSLEVEGKPVTGRGGVLTDVFDYSHLLPPELQHYGITVHTRPNGGLVAKVGRKLPGEPHYNWPEAVMVHGHALAGSLEPHVAPLKDRKAAGAAVYALHALVAHARNHHGIRTVEVPTHTPAASNLIRRYIGLIGAQYQGQPIPNEYQQIAQQEGAYMEPYLTEPSHLMSGFDVTLKNDQWAAEEPLEKMAVIDPTANQDFYTWSGGHHIKDAKGQPKKLYHGTTHSFDTFGKKRGNPENFMGVAHYFTDNPNDASENYAGEGPDLRNRVSQRAEAITYDDNYDYGDNVTDSPYDAARKELVGRSPSVVPAYVKMKNPMYIEAPAFGQPGFKKTYLDERRLYAALQKEAIGDMETGTQNLSPEAISDIVGRASTGGELVAALQDHGVWGDHLQRIVRRLGHDGVIMDASRFRLPHASGTTHYIVFSPHQVKGIFNKTFSRSPNFGKGEPEDLNKMALAYEIGKHGRQPVTVYRIEDAYGRGPYQAGASGYDTNEYYELTRQGRSPPPGRKVQTPSGKIAQEIPQEEGEEARVFRPSPYLPLDPQRTLFQAGGNVDRRWLPSSAIFGFAKPEDALHWFGKDALERMHQNGFRLRAVPAAKVWLSSSGRQLIFHPHDTYKKGDESRVVDIKPMLDSYEPEWKPAKPKEIRKPFRRSEDIETVWWLQDLRKDMADFKQVGEELGSNPGGTFVHPQTGEKYYFKFQPTNDHAKNEILAHKLYDAAGVGALDMRPLKLGKGRIGTGTKWVKAEPLNVADPDHMAQARKLFALHAWLANWDHHVHGNMAMRDGQISAMDLGGALLFRARGEPKPSFGNSVDEWDSLRQHDYKGFFKDITPQELQESAKMVASVDDATIDRLVKEHGPGDDKQRARLAGILKARRQDVLRRANG